MLLKCLEKEEINVSQRFAWTLLQVLNGPTVPEEEMKLGCVSVAVADLVGSLTDFQRQFALLSFVKALLSSDNNLILFTEGTLQTPLFLSFFELIKELYSHLEDAQLVYQYFQGIQYTYANHFPHVCLCCQCIATAYRNVLTMPLYLYMYLYSVCSVVGAFACLHRQDLRGWSRSMHGVH